MTEQIPVAKAGDVCVLVEPAAEEKVRLRRLQTALQSRFGGLPQERTHFTCQRFDYPQEVALAAIVAELGKELAIAPPFRVAANTLELVRHPFWEFLVLRWDLRVTPAMRFFAARVETVLENAGATLHYPRNSGWRPHVTALEAVADRQLPSDNGHDLFDQFLFTARRIVLSQVRDGKEFEIVYTIELTG